MFFTRGKTKWKGENSLKGINWMYHYSNSEWNDQRSERNMCTIVTFIWLPSKRIINFLWFQKLNWTFSTPQTFLINQTFNFSVTLFLYKSNLRYLNNIHYWIETTFYGFCLSWRQFSEAHFPPIFGAAHS